MFYPNSLSVQQLNLIANTKLIFPNTPQVKNDVVITDIIDVISSQIEYNIYLPDSTQTAPGFMITFNNVSAFPFTIMLNDTVTKLIHVNPSDVLQIYLTDNTAVNGIWNIIPLAINGQNALTSLVFSSPDKSILISNPIINPPGGNVSLTLPSSISAATMLDTFGTLGFVVVDSTNPLTYRISILQESENILITQPNGVTNDPTISLNPNIKLTELKAGNVIIFGNSISNFDVDGILNINSNGLLSKLYLNKVLIDSEGNVSKVKNLHIDGSLITPNLPKAWCRFSNNNGQISLPSKYNIDNVSYNNINYQYLITFINPMLDVNYGVSISCSNSVTTPNTIVRIGYDIVRELNYCIIVVVDGAGEFLPDLPAGITVSILSL